MKYIISLLLALCTSTMCFAQSTMQYYIVFPSNSVSGARSDTVMTNPPASVGIAAPWTQVNGDAVASDYTLNDDLATVTYNPPVVTPAAVPNPSKFASDVMADTNISTTAKVYLAPYNAVISGYNSQTASTIKTLWQGLIQEFGSTWLDSNTQTLIQNHAAANNMPLV